ncbi:MAG: NAD(P)/FAD-dependent oxidoreductase [Methanobacterium sp.]
MNLKINFDYEPFSKITITDGLRRKENFSDEKPLFYLIRRGDVPGSLDLGLKKQALELGVNFHFEKIINENQVDIVATGPIKENIFAIGKGIIFKTDMDDTAVVIFNDMAAFKGYAYLLVTKGNGCLCTVLFDNFSSIHTNLAKTKEIFSNMYSFEIQKLKKFGGVGCFTPKNQYTKGKILFVGEVAGLQDLLWGYGMRYALTSGFLAAQSIINGDDYDQMIKTRFKNKLNAGVVNRYLWEKASRNNYSLIYNHTEWIIKNTHWISNYNILQRIIYPFALQNFEKKLNQINY